MPSVDTKQMATIYEIYARTKYLMLKAEEFPGYEAYLQPRLELYNAFDNFMVAYQDANESGTDIDLSSTVKRIYTAFFDIADWLNIRIKKIIVEELGKHDPEDISRAIPEYYNEIRPALDRITDEVSTIRANKAREKADEVEKYVQLMEQSLGYLATIRSAKSSLSELKRKRRLKSPWIAYILAFIAIVVAVVFFFLGQ